MPDAKDENANHGAPVIKRLVFSASLWSMTGSVAGQIASFAIFVILARLLSPFEFGLVAFLALFVDLTRSVIVGGIPEALIQRKEWSKPAADTAFWLNVAATAAIVLIALAAALAAPSGASTQVGWLFVALSLTLVIDGARAVSEAHLRRSFSYRALAMRTISASLIGGVAGVAAALLGLGVWSLVVQRLVTSLVQTATIWMLGSYRPGMQVAAAEIRPLLSFSLKVMVGRLMGQMNGRLPDFVIGSIAGPAALGLFRVASRSLNFLVQSLMMPLQTTALSAFARLHDRSAVARAYSRFTQACALVIFPAFLGSAAVAPDFMRVFFGEQWIGGAPIMIALSFAVLPRALFQFFQSAMQAIGRPQRAIGPEATRLVSGAVIVTAASFAGPLAAAIADTGRRYLDIPQSIRILEGELGLAPSRLAAAIALPMAFSVCMAGLLVTLQWTWMHDWQPGVRLAACVAIGAALYPALFALFGREYLRDVAVSVRQGLPSRLQKLVDRALGFIFIKLPVAAQHV